MDSLERRIETKDSFEKRVYKNWQRLGLDRKPYDATPAMVDTVWEMVGSSCSDFRARRLLYWFKENYYSAGKGDYQSAGRTFISKTGLCVDSAVLYTTMAKIAGLESYVALVTKKGNGRPFSHMCSLVYLDNKIVLVDPQFKVFDPFYVEFRVFDDSTARAAYYNYMIKFNERNKNAAFKFEDKVLQDLRPHINYRSGYDKQCKKYITFANEKINEKLVAQIAEKERVKHAAYEEEPFAERLVDSIALDFAKTLFVRGIRALAIPIAFSVGLGLQDTIELRDLYNAARYPFMDRAYDNQGASAETSSSGNGIIYRYAENFRDVVLDFLEK